MMKIIELIFLVLLLPAILCAQSTPQSQSDQKKNELINQILVKSGISKTIEMLPTQIDQQINESATSMLKINPELKIKIPQMIKMIKQDFDSKQLLILMTQKLQSNFNEKELLAFLESLEAPLIQKMSAMEEKANTTELPTKIAAFVKDVEDQKIQLSQDKMVALKKLDDQTKMSELAITNILGIYRGVVYAFTGKLPQSSDLGALRVQMLPQIQVSMLLSLLYIYQNAPDKDVTAYVDLMTGNPLHLKFNGQCMSVFHEYFEHWSISIGTSLARSQNVKKARHQKVK